jgi:hypothetical protein
LNTASAITAAKAVNHEARWRIGAPCTWRTPFWVWIQEGRRLGKSGATNALDRKTRWKRGGRLERVELEGLELAEDTPPGTLLVLNEALEKLAAEDAPKAELVRLRFFIGLTYAEAAKVLGLSDPTVKRYWDFFRA